MQIKIPCRFLRIAGWIACFAGCALGIVFAIGILVTGGELWAAPVSFACCALAGGALGATWLNHAPRVTISQKGILAKRFFCAHFYEWKDFIQTGVRCTQNRSLYFHEIVLLLPGGSKRKKYDNLFFLRNFWNILYLPYTDDILMYVLQCYGKLDFCFMNGSLEEDYYTIEELSEQADSKDAT